jgi:nucleoside-diphosphate-sugar epimerase
MKIEGRTILVTGATGFVGGRLAERLLLSKRQIRVRGLVHNSSNAARLARLPVDIMLGDMTSFDQVKKIMHGCDIVVHCAIGDSYHATVKGTENVLRAASEIGIEKFIHISSFAVFGYSPSTEANGSERITYNHTGDAYCDSKIDSEKIAFYYYDTKKLPLVVLRPTNIFGPYSKPYTIRPINMLKRKCYVLIDGGNSPSNAVYIDNVIEAIELAILTDSAIGQALLISDDRPVTWRDFFSAYASMFSPSPPLLNLALEDIAIERARQHGAIFRQALSNPTRIARYGPSFIRESTFLNSIASKASMEPVRNQLVQIISRFPEAIKAKAVETMSENDTDSNEVPNNGLIKIFTSRVHFSIKDAKETLGYKPVVSFEKGMKLTEHWLKFQRLL